MITHGEDGEFEQLEADVIRWLLSRQDVQDSVRVALAGHKEKATTSLLTIVRGLLAGDDHEDHRASSVQAPEQRLRRQREDDDITVQVAKRPWTLESHPPTRQVQEMIAARRCTQPKCGDTSRFCQSSHNEASATNR